MAAIDWARVAANYALKYPQYTELPFFLGDLAGKNPHDIVLALQPEIADGFKVETTLFFLVGVEEGAADHVLTDLEFEELRHVARLLRIRDGEVLKFHKEKARALLCREVEILFRDMAVDPEEALYKTKLQALLGLSYDECSSLIREEIEKILAFLVEAIGAGSLSELNAEGKLWLQKRLNALDTVFNIGSRTYVRSIHNFGD